MLIGGQVISEMISTAQYGLGINDLMARDQLWRFRKCYGVSMVSTLSALNHCCHQVNHLK